jgi:DNA-binding GntR family transcriptional regulator
VRIKKETSLTETVYRALRADLVLCKIQPGTHLKTSEFAQLYGVSLASVREAMARLSAEGLVDSEPQRGFFATPISAERLLDLTTVRLDIESNCIRSSIVQFSTLDDVKLEEALETLSTTAETDETGRHVMSENWIRAHIAFHEALVAGCRSSVLLQIRRQLFDQSERYRSLSLQLGTGKQKADIDADHRPLVQAVKRRDTNNAVKLLTEHINSTTRVLLRARVNGKTLLPRISETLIPAGIGKMSA